MCSHMCVSISIISWLLQLPHKNRGHLCAWLCYTPRYNGWWILNRLHQFHVDIHCCGAKTPNLCFSTDYFFFYFFIYILFLFFIIWRLITLQYCSGFCHTLTWISHGFTCIPHPDPPSHLPLHPIPLSLPSVPGPSTCLMHPTWAGDLFHPR